jgi:hypothetical protein
VNLRGAKGAATLDEPLGRVPCAPLRSVAKSLSQNVEPSGSGILAPWSSSWQCGHGILGAVGAGAGRPGRPPGGLFINPSNASDRAGGPATGLGALKVKSCVTYLLVSINLYYIYLISISNIPAG